MLLNINRKKIIMVIINIIFTLIFFLLYYLANNISQVTVVGILQYIWMIGTWYIATRNVMNIYLFFLALSFCFYLGQPILYLLNIDIINIMSITNSPFSLMEINSTLIFLLSGMALFHLGASFTVEELTNVKEARINKAAIKFVGICLFIVSAIPALNFTINSLVITFTEGYSNIFSSDFVQGSGIEGGLPRLLAGFFEPSLLLLILGNLDNKKQRKFWVFFTIIYSLIMIISGQRGINALFLISVVLLYHYVIKGFTKKQIFNFIFILLASLFAFSAISSLRNVALIDYNLTEIFSSILEENFLVSFLAETGFTLIACTTVMIYSPSVIPFNEGVTYINSLLALIPNLFWDVHPAANGGVDQVFKSFLMEDSGIGSSFIIEGYYNFGRYGLIIMPIFGFLVGKIYYGILKSSKSKNYLSFYIYISLVPIFLWFIRSETITFWRNFGYYIIFPIILIVCYSLYAKKKRYSIQNLNSIDKT